LSALKIIRLQFKVTQFLNTVHFKQNLTNTILIIMKTLNSFLSANQSSEVVLNLNQLNVLKGGDGNTSTSNEQGEIVEKNPPIYIKE